MSSTVPSVISSVLQPGETILWFGTSLSKKDTHYAITNRRTIIAVADDNKGKVSAEDICKIKGEFFVTKKDGTGTIYLGLRPHRVSRFSNPILDELTGHSETGAIIFHDIEDCEKVMKIYLDVRYPES